MENQQNKDILNQDDNKTFVDLFQNNPIISKNDIVSFKECKDFIIQTYLTVPMYRSLPIKLFGVLSNKDFPTPEAKYFQCLAEAEVHSKELVRDLHDLENMKIDIEKSEFVLNIKIPKQIEQETNSLTRQEIEFDARKIAVNISRQKFEYAQLQKRIKYRIEEVSEWKKISDKLQEVHNVDVSNYAGMLTKALESKWESELSNPKLTENERKDISAKLSELKTVKKAFNK